MKKILTVVLLCVMTMFACSACAEGVIGEWYADMYGMVAKMTVNEDGTYALDMAGSVQNGTWVLEETNLIMDKGTDNEGVFVYDAAAQKLDMAGQLVFTRTVIEQWVPAAVRAEAAIEDFTGLWNALHVDAFGALLTVEAADVYMTASIEGTNVSLTMTFVEAETFEGEAVLEGNVLTLNIPAKDDFSKEMVFTASVLEDGSILINADLFSSPATFYLEKVEELP